MKVNIKYDSSSWVLGEYIRFKYESLNEQCVTDNVSNEKVRIKSSFKGELLDDYAMVPHYSVGTKTKISFILSGREVETTFLLENKKIPKYDVVVNRWGIVRKEYNTINLPKNTLPTQHNITIDIDVFNDLDTNKSPFVNGNVLYNALTNDVIYPKDHFQWDIYEKNGDEITYNSTYVYITHDELVELQKPTLEDGWEKYIWQKDFVSNRLGWNRLVIDGVLWDEQTDLPNLKLVSQKRLGNGGGRYRVDEFELYIKSGSDIDIISQGDYDDEQRYKTSQATFNPFSGLSGLLNL